MAKQGRPTLKGYFETGDTPSQANYIDFIDSKLNLSDTGVQIAVGTISASILDVSVSITGTNITSSNNISASGAVIGTTLTGTILTATQTNITSVGTLTSITSAGNSILGNALTDTHTFTGHVTSSGNISSSIGTGSFGSLKVDGSSVDFSGLPTSDPGITGRLYNSSGTIKISV
jgi:hypothetical protein